MIRITDSLEIDESAITLDFVRASGPGGQNVNKVSSAVQLRFDSAGLPGDVRHRLRGLAGQRMTKDGTVIIEAQQFRSQERNREDALQRLVELLQQAAVRPKRRIKTRPTKGSKERRLDGKRRRSETKQGRRGGFD